uniref:Uncharacterized protein n=1 Tax=Astyanax mexicanus TaxID=7994 RepID=A0A8B9HQ58_ASTMX
MDANDLFSSCRKGDVARVRSVLRAKLLVAHTVHSVSKQT